MKLIELTGVPHSDVDDGKPQKVFIDPSRILLVNRTKLAHAKEGSIENRRQMAEDLRNATRALLEKVHGYQPDMTDPVALSWMMQAKTAAGEVQAAFLDWSKAFVEQDYYPMVACTEISMACGTGLEHGVMLAKVWVSETPEQVAHIINHQTTVP